MLLCHFMPRKWDTSAGLLGCEHWKNPVAGTGSVTTETKIHTMGTFWGISRKSLMGQSCLRQLLWAWPRCNLPKGQRFPLNFKTGMSSASAEERGKMGSWFFWHRFAAYLWKKQAGLQDWIYNPKHWICGAHFQSVQAWSMIWSAVQVQEMSRELVWAFLSFKADLVSRKHQTKLWRAVPWRRRCCGFVSLAPTTCPSNLAHSLSSGPIGSHFHAG